MGFTKVSFSIGLSTITGPTPWRPLRKLALRSIPSLARFKRNVEHDAKDRRCQATNFTIFHHGLCITIGVTEACKSTHNYRGAGYDWFIILQFH